MLNRVCLNGRLVRDPETRTTTGGKECAEFTVAVNKIFKRDDGPDADFFRVKAWGKTAEFVGNYLEKGRLVSIDGRLEQRSYTDKEGNKREIIEIVADNVQGLDKAPEGSAPATNSGGRTATPPEEFDPFAD